MADPSDGGDATSAAMKGAAASVKSAKDATAPALVKSAKDATSPAPVKAGEDRPDEIQFHGFSDLPVTKAEGVAKSEGVALPHILLKGSNSEEADASKINNLKRGYLERSEADSPKRYKPCIDEAEVNMMLYGSYAKSDENVSIKENLKRAVAHVTSDESDESDSPTKRSRVEMIRKAMADVNGGDIQDHLSEDTDTNTVVACSPIERGLKFANALGRLAVKSFKERAKSLDERAVSLNKREGSLDKWEASLDKREGSLNKREANVEKREANVQKLEALSAKKAEDDATPKPAKGSEATKAIEKSINAISTADTYVTVAEKLSNIPKRGSDFVKNYNENKIVAEEFLRKHNNAIAEKVKAYMTVSTTAGAVSIAKAAVMEGLKLVLGLEGDEAAVPEGDEAAAPEGDEAAAPGSQMAAGDDASGAVVEPAGATEAESRK